MAFGASGIGASEPGNIGERGLPGMDVHAPELGAAVQRGKYLARVEQTAVVEGAFEPLLLGVPPGVSPEDNELGWQMSMGKLAALVEGRDAGS